MKVIWILQNGGEKDKISKKKLMDDEKKRYKKKRRRSIMVLYKTKYYIYI